MLAIATMLTVFAAWAFMGDDDVDTSDDETADEPIATDAPDGSGDTVLDYLLETDTNEPDTNTGVRSEGKATAQDDETVLAQDALDVLPGGDNDDILVGDADGGTIDGGAGDDIVTGVFAAQDQATEITDLVGQTSHYLLGGEGDDSLMGGANDFMDGGAGRDVYFIDGTLDPQSSPPVIKDFDPSEDSIVICIPTNEAELEETWPDRPVFDGDVTVSDGEEMDQYVVQVDGAVVALVTSKVTVDASNISVAKDGYVGPTLFDIQYGYQ